MWMYANYSWNLGQIKVLRRQTSPVEDMWLLKRSLHQQDAVQVQYGLSEPRTSRKWALVLVDHHVSNS